MVRGRCGSLCLLVGLAACSGSDPSGSAIADSGSSAESTALSADAPSSPDAGPASIAPTTGPCGELTLEQAGYARCGSACPCGCMACQFGNVYCSENDVVRCGDQGCYETIDTCATVGACLSWSEGSGCLERLSCADIVKAYDAQVSKAITAIAPGESGFVKGPYVGACGADGECPVAPGHCSVGLGGCWYLGVYAPILDALANRYVELGCAPAATCDCPAKPATVRCETNPDAGGWGDGGNRYTYACVVR